MFLLPCHIMYSRKQGNEVDDDAHQQEQEEGFHVPPQ